MGIHLRSLEEKDAPFMLEWMQDEDINRFFRFDGSSKTIADCEEFIKKSGEDEGSRHFAVADERDEYLGTISLKDIKDGRAEYAISMRKKAHGSGAAMEATKEILRVAFEDMNLNEVYLNVLVDNARANAFYGKAGFQFVRCEENAVEIKGKLRDLNWYTFRK